jgi:hypothetical protein
MSTSFITKDENGVVLKNRVEALKDIIKMSVDRDLSKKR